MPRTIVITGASDGIGAAAARALAQGGDRVVVVGRTPAKVESVAQACGGADSFVADFARLADVRGLASDLLARYPRIDVLVNNAGGFFDERAVTEDGHEFTFQVNHLATFLLTTLLVPRLAESKASVITTSSRAHLRGRLDLADLELSQRWSGWRAYANSKLANVLFMRGLNRRHGLEGIASVAFHPGLVSSAFGTQARGATRWFYTSPLAKRIMLTPEQGADTLVWLAQGSPPRDWAPGMYYVDRLPAAMSKLALDDTLADAFWALSERMVT